MLPSGGPRLPSGAELSEEDLALLRTSLQRCFAAVDAIPAAAASRGDLASPEVQDDYVDVAAIATLATGVATPGDAGEDVKESLRAPPTLPSADAIRVIESRPADTRIIHILPCCQHFLTDALAAVPHWCFAQMC
eukprot:TRINITY_DN13416_c0_g1_i3.p2 TRINITY_DN13416_c0_g1~~TRINITY_DN13416_c0_g1_i3.p2  ORF type:complete len:135 (-),score=19.18 TRINITY_DN13416_c0_g1_i3:33-437(-)